VRLDRDPGDSGAGGFFRMNPLMRADFRLPVSSSVDSDISSGLERAFEGEVLGKALFFFAEEVELL